MFLVFWSCSDSGEPYINGCMDSTACNSNLDATSDDGSCTYPETNFDCENNCIVTVDACGDCGGNVDNASDCCADGQVADCTGTCGGGAVEDCNGDCFHEWYLQFPGVGNGLCNDPWIDVDDDQIVGGLYNMVDESNLETGTIFTINSYPSVKAI